MAIPADEKAIGVGLTAGADGFGHGLVADLGAPAADFDASASERDDATVVRCR